MTDHDHDQVGVEERYSSAVTSSNLRVEAEKRSDADVLIAAAWSASRVGAALMRLRTEYDSGQKHRSQASATDQRLLIDRLKSLPDVRRELATQALIWGVERAEETSLSVLAWWVAPVCRHCSGRKFEVIKDTPALSTKKCGHCRGTGEARLPHGEAGKRLAQYMDDCVNRAQQSIKNRLRNRSAV